MFTMTSDITIGSYMVKANRVEWKSSTGDFTDTCSLILPLAPYVRHRDQTTSAAVGMGMGRVERCPFGKGDEVTVCLGYGGRNMPVFRGFVLRVNFRNQLVIECEGYAYLLRERYFSKSYAQTTVKDLLKELVAGTGIELSPHVDHIPLTNVWFKNAPAHKVLEWLQKECCCQVFFDGKYLYAGASRYVYADPDRSMRPVKVRVGWNVVNADDLKLRVPDSVQIEIVEKNAQGQVKRTKSEQTKYSTVREVKVRPGLPADFLRRAARQLQDDQNYSGFEGCISLFGEPHVFKCDKIVVADERFPERAGNYFAEAVEGSFGEGGFRRKVKIRSYD